MSPRTPPATIRSGAPIATRTRTLLAAGILAGPLFLAVGLVHAFTREGFDLGRHPLSLLSLGDLGWIQIANFVVTGVLYLACAVGMRRALHPGRAGTWGPILVGGLGVGLILAGVFVTDAGAGFPPGAPAGPPEISWHGIVHGVGAGLALDGMIVGCLVFARRFHALGERRWVLACIATAASVLILTAWPDMDGISVRLVVASAILFVFVGAVAARLIRDLPREGAHHDQGPNRSIDLRGWLHRGRRRLRAATAGCRGRSPLLLVDRRRNAQPLRPDVHDVRHQCGVLR